MAALVGVKKARVVVAPAVAVAPVVVSLSSPTAVVRLQPGVAEPLLRIVL